MRAVLFYFLLTKSVRMSKELLEHQPDGRRASLGLLSGTNIFSRGSKCVGLRDGVEGRDDEFVGKYVLI
jgi:hypothetical protein